MNRKIINCISTVDEFKLESYRDLDIGVEIQDFVEPNLTDDQVESTIKTYKSLFRDFSNIKSLHGPFLDLKPASPDKDIRRISQGKYFRTLEIAEELDIDYVIFHSQINPLLNEDLIMDLNLRQAGDFYNILMDQSSYKSMVLIENIFERDPIVMLRLIDKIDSERVKLILDLGHAKLSGSSMETWIKELKDHLAYIHFHSNDGVYDQHKSPSKEEIEELYYLLDKYQIDPVIALEYKKENLREEIGRYR